MLPCRRLFFLASLLLTVTGLCAPGVRFIKTGKFPVRKIQIFGERCSGTNYCEALIRQNLRDVDLTWEFGWKHFPPWIIGKQASLEKLHTPAVHDTLFLIVVRHPFEWSKSLFQRPFHIITPRDQSYVEFLAMPLLPEISIDDYQRHPITGEYFMNCGELRTWVLRNMLKYRKHVDHYCLVRYEDLRDCPDQILTQISRAFHIPKVAPFVPVIHRVSGNGEEGVFVASGYGTSLFERSVLVENLDRALEYQIGYDWQFEGDSTFFQHTLFRLWRCYFLASSGLKKYARRAQEKFFHFFRKNRARSRACIHKCIQKLGI